MTTETHPVVEMILDIIAEREQCPTLQVFTELASELCGELARDWPDAVAEYAAALDACHMCGGAGAVEAAKNPRYACNGGTAECPVCWSSGDASEPCTPPTLDAVQTAPLTPTAFCPSQSEQDAMETMRGTVPMMTAAQSDVLDAYQQLCSTPPVELTARAKAFASECICEHRFLVDGDDVRVWDDVAGHYTTCHALGASAVRRIRRIAAEVAS